jgi:threonine dehydrogenase-like Zn-dependent dehydrogenase
MKALQFEASVPRYLLGRTLGSVYKPFHWSGFSCLRYGDAPEPALPGPDWVKIKTRYGGICGTDWGLIQLHSSPYLSPFSSQRFVIGHENLGTISEVGSEVEGWSAGDRAVAELLLPCAVRGFAEPCPACLEGNPNLCRNFGRGDLAPGTILGSCADTGGSWGPVYVANQSQLVRVPENVSDENVILLDALASALHPIMRYYPRDEQTVLILGAGTIGLCAIASLRALGSRARILVLAKYGFQGDLARDYGADEVVWLDRGSDHYQQIADLTGGQIYRPILGKPVLIGGPDIVYECTGSDAAMDDALHLVTAGGTVVVVGATGVAKGIDWTPIWFHEITVAGSSMTSVEIYSGQRMRTYEVGLDLMARDKIDLAQLMTHSFRLQDYREAFGTLAAKGSSKALKVVFSYD